MGTQEPGRYVRHNESQRERIITATAQLVKEWGLVTDRGVGLLLTLWDGSCFWLGGALGRALTLGWSGYLAEEGLNG